jgi:quercetin dioxygenase-like cupin family protein
MAMTTLNAFASTAQEGRTREPLELLGAQIMVKLSTADSNGAAAIFRQTMPPNWGPPLHRHSREDEWFYILEGEITAEIDGQRTVLQGGGSAFAPRGTAHRFKVSGPRPAKMLVMVTPGGFDQFFEELASLNRGLANPDLAGMERLMKAYGMELLGPPIP